MVEQHRIRVPYVNTINNLGDFFTKCQPPKTFRAMRDIIMNVAAVSGPRPRGGVESKGLQCQAMSMTRNVRTRYLLSPHRGSSKEQLSHATKGDSCCATALHIRIDRGDAACREAHRCERCADPHLSVCLRWSLQSYCALSLPVRLS